MQGAEACACAVPASVGQKLERDDTSHGSGGVSISGVRHSGKGEDAKEYPARATLVAQAVLLVSLHLWSLTNCRRIENVLNNFSPVSP